MELMNFDFRKEDLEVLIIKFHKHKVSKNFNSTFKKKDNKLQKDSCSKSICYCYDKKDYISKKYLDNKYCPRKKHRKDVNIVEVIDSKYKDSI